MALLHDALSGGWISLFAIIVLWAETAVLSLLSAKPQRRFRALCANACAGTCLLAALGLALRGADSVWILILLTASLVAHAIDIRLHRRDQGWAFSRWTE